MSYSTFSSLSKVEVNKKLMIPVNTSVVSGVALSEFDGETKILMIKRVNGGFWCHVAGKIDG